MKKLSIFFFLLAALILTNIVQAEPEIETKARSNPKYKVGSSNDMQALLLVMATTGFEHGLRYKCKDSDGNVTQDWRDLSNGETGLCLASVLIAIKADCENCKKKRLRANGCVSTNRNFFSPSMIFYVNDNGNDKVERRCRLGY